MTLLVLALFLLAGCGSESGSDSDDGGDGTELLLYGTRVKACTPLLDEGSPSSGQDDLATWDGWDPGADPSVLGKLFDEGIGGDECLFTLVGILDSHIDMVNEFSNDWGTSGTYTRSGMTAVVDTSVTTVTVPYLGVDSPFLMERLITLSVPDEDLTIHMAFTHAGEHQMVVEQYTIGDTRSGVYLAEILRTTVRIWTASIRDSKVQIMWDGDTSSKWFTISECTNAAGGNWEAMGGGSISSDSSEMAFMARNRATNDSNDEYYLSISSIDLRDGIEQTVYNADTTPPDGNGALAYITSGKDSYVGFLGYQEYPKDIEDLDWDSAQSN